MTNQLHSQIKKWSVVCMCVVLFFFLGGSFCQGKTIIMTYGDSITAGYPYVEGAAGGCICGPMQAKLESHLDTNQPSQVINWGKGGESTAGGASRLESRILATKTDYGDLHYVLLLEGTNDYNYGFSSDTTQYNLGLMIDTIREHKITPLLGTLTPDTVTTAKDIPGYNTKIKDLASSKEVVLVDHYAAMLTQWPTENYDGLHPNRAGYDHMATNWYEELTDMIDNDCTELPVINSFTVLPEKVDRGQSVILSWDITGADFVDILTGSGSSVYVSDNDLTEDSVVVFPEVSTSYTLSAYNTCSSVRHSEETVEVVVNVGVFPWMPLLLDLRRVK